MFLSWALSNLKALGSSQEMAHHGNKLLHFLKRVEIKQRHLDVAVFTLHAVLLLMANLRDARFYSVSFNEQFVCRVEIAA